jgi:serine protease Do
MKCALLVLLAFVTGCSGCATSRADLKSTALRLEFQAGVLCSGTMRGPHEFSTARHCIDGGEKVTKVNDQKVEMIGWRLTGKDSVIVSVRGVTFKHWPRTGVAHQGDRVFWWGNPLGARDMYREGYVSGFFDGNMVVDATICHGDSGSGVFNEYGELVGIVSAMNNEAGCTFMLAVSESK